MGLHWKRNTESTTARGLGWEWQQQRLRILARDCGLCQVCARNGRITIATEVDHIIPRAKSGTHDRENLQSICGACHKAKTLEDEGKRVRPTIGRDGWPVG